MSRRRARLSGGWAGRAGGIAGRPGAIAGGPGAIARILLWLTLLVALSGLVTAPVGAQSEVALDSPTASGAFGETVTFETTFETATPPQRVELLLRQPWETAHQVEIAALEPVGEDRWRAVVHLGGHIVPNTPYVFRFRVVTDDGAVLGPEGSHRVEDQRIDWRSLDGEHVRVWWAEGDEAFARRALSIAEEALTSAADLLGVTDVAPLDFFVYSDAREFREAMGPATRENVGGQAHPGIRTMFGVIEPRQVSSGWVEELVSHELTHLVFDEAAANPYQYPPRWLNEGLAVYLSKGYDRADQAQVESAADSGAIIPLEGLAGQFPTRPTRIRLAYAESVAAVDHLVQTHGEEALVALITAFGAGDGLDAAFVAATGADFQAFDASWLASLGAQPPATYGPRVGEPGPVPSAWTGEAGALLRSEGR